MVEEAAVNPADHHCSKRRRTGPYTVHRVISAADLTTHHDCRTVAVHGPRTAGEDCLMDCLTRRLAERHPPDQTELAFPLSHFVLVGIRRRFLYQYAPAPWHPLGLPVDWKPRSNTYVSTPEFWPSFPLRTLDPGRPAFPLRVTFVTVCVRSPRCYSPHVCDVLLAVFMAIVSHWIPVAQKPARSRDRTL